ncbi:DUF5709 domain-containing protein [Nocardioides sp.]|uniref:DUF5709 domain-containing protein n=1 Tax=Nocardioides sp. TaxID=35761 RepID=UPI0027366DC4|nr:DUF5709 domain-containing protein [Nocardioides sp.]MDP3894156.1 DUF5709 domain-containing protein [Nocardioides sp.]
MSEQPEGVADQIGTDPSVDVSGDSSDQEIYHGYSVDDENQPQDTGDSLVDDDRGISDPLDEGWNPPENWSAGQRYGNTPLEESVGETLDQRLEQEIPEPDPYEAARTEVENVGGEVGGARAGRLVAPDEGAHEDVESDLIAEDVGIDGAAAGAEEAAVHVVDPDDMPEEMG